MWSGDVLVVSEDEAELAARLWLNPVDVERCHVASWQPLCGADAVSAGVDFSVGARGESAVYSEQSSFPNRFSTGGLVLTISGHVSHRKIPLSSGRELKRPAGEMILFAAGTRSPTRPPRHLISHGPGICRYARYCVRNVRIVGENDCLGFSGCRDLSCR